MKALSANEFSGASTLEDEQGWGGSVGESGDNNKPMQRRSLVAVMSRAWARRAASRHGEWRHRRRRGTVVEQSNAMVGEGIGVGAARVRLQA